MKRLLILLILSQIVLLAQNKAQGVIGTNQNAEASNIQSMSALMSNDRCTRVAEIRTDNIGGVTTIVVFRYNITPQDTVGTAAPDTVIVAANTVNTEPPAANTPTEPPKDIAIKTPVAEMHLSPDGYSLLQKLEGYAPALYDLGDGGYTIGFGFFIPYNERYKWLNGITWEKAAELIQQKVPAYEAQVKKYVNVPLTQNEFDALTLLAYNLGGFSKATSIINDINEQVDLDQLQRDWKRFVHSKAPNVSKGLMNRRKDEIDVRKSSNYQPDRKIQILKSKK